MYWYQKVLHNTREQPSTVGDSVTLYFDLDSELNFHAVRYLQAPWVRRTESWWHIEPSDAPRLYTY